MVSGGVGGRSVEEAKERLSAAEVLKWQAYVQRRGSLNLGMRIEAGFALIAVAINAAVQGKIIGGKDPQPRDFMPHYEAPEATINDVMKLLSGKK